MFKYKATVLSIYDADTITVELRKSFPIGFGMRLDWVWTGRKCRLFGINAPEMRGPEKADGTIARDALRELILGKEVILETRKDKSGKYGRLLVDVYLGDLHINPWLVMNGYARWQDY